MKINSFRSSRILLFEEYLIILKEHQIVVIELDFSLGDKVIAPSFRREIARFFKIVVSRETIHAGSLMSKIVQPTNLPIFKAFIITHHNRVGIKKPLQGSLISSKIFITEHGKGEVNTVVHHHIHGVVFGNITVAIYIVGNRVIFSIDNIIEPHLFYSLHHLVIKAVNIVFLGAVHSKEFEQTLLYSMFHPLRETDSNTTRVVSGKRFVPHPSPKKPQNKAYYHHIIILYCEPKELSYPNAQLFYQRT